VVHAPYVTVENAWVRPMVKGQSATGGFMVLTASQDLTLVGFATAAAGTSELHEMAMDGQVMRMRAIDALKLPAGQAVTLRPGAHHLMLMDVKQPLKAGEELILTLKLKAADGKALTQDIKVPVKAAQMQQPMNQEMHQHMHHGKAPAPASATSK
jgi:copper(I)-binding protein